MAHLKISSEPDDPPPPYSETQDALTLISGLDIASSDETDARQPASFLPSKRDRDFHNPLQDSHSSSQSLVSPPRSSSDSRRTLLLVYIHGFYGNDQSFRSFPAHVHRFLSASPSLSQSHLIHSKVYPRYKTYKAIDVARDNFSVWLEPHESPTTDVILIGHSMGGLLAAEVVLKPSDIFQHQHPFKHRILGTISLDSPFLGLHPGIVVSGISSLFRPESQPPAHVDNGVDAGVVGTSSTPESLPSFPGPPLPRRPPTDPNFDPPYFNDAPFREKPLFDRLVNFASKHSNEGLFNALGNHITHHLEFGGCLADYHGLMSRYNRIRALEDVDETNTAQQHQYVYATTSRVRVRFVNYYTLCPGRPKPAKSPPEKTRSLSQTDLSSAVSTHDEAFTEDGGGDIIDETQIQIEPAQSPAQALPKASLSSTLPLQELEPIPIMEPDEPPEQQTQDDTESQTDKLSSQFSIDSSSLPPHIPPPPSPPPAKPEAPDFSQYIDKDIRKQAEKEFARREKSYNEALKLHAKTLRERQKLVDKQNKQLQRDKERKLKEAKREADRSIKEAQRVEKEAAKEKHRQEKEEKKRLEREASEAAAAEKPKKLKKFCNVPGQIHGAAMDRTWVSVYMDGVDEVGAHCGLFVPGEHYDKLVEDVGGRIVAWIHGE